MQNKKKINYNSTKDITVRIFKECIYPNRYYFLIAILFMIVSAICTSYRAYLIKPAIDKVFVNKNVASLALIPIQMIIVAIITCITNYVQGFLMQKTNNLIVMDLQEKLFRKLIHNDINFFQKQSSGKINAYFGDIVGITSVVDIVLNRLVLQFFTLIALIGLMFYQNVKLSILSFIAFPIIILPIIKIGRKMRKLSHKNREKSLSISSYMTESFDNIEIIKGNNKEEFEISKIKKILQEIYKLSIKIAKKSLVVSPMMEMVGTVGFALVILYGGHMVIMGKSTAGEFFVFLTALFSAYKPAKSFSGVNIHMQNAIACARRFFIIIDKENDIKEIENPIVANEINGNICFKNVEFHYPLNDITKDSVEENEQNKLTEKYALKNITLNITKGKSYALVGHSGSGKSTIFNLLLRFYDATSGEILIDNINIKNLSLKTLRNNISLVSQDVKLFNATIFENIKYAKENATFEDIIQAAKMANVDEFVEKLPEKYNTIIGPNGSFLSGGQKQRISIARAILKNSPILMLDEATSALDPISEYLIQKSLKILMKDKTTIIIAHRLSTIVNCDHIFVLENGELKEQGNHKELLTINKIYKNLCDKQFHMKND